MRDNRLGDGGGRAMATVMRWNRTLAEFDLAGNGIHDEGCAAM